MKYVANYDEVWLISWFIHVQLLKLYFLRNGQHKKKDWFIDCDNYLNVIFFFLLISFDNKRNYHIQDRSFKGERLQEHKQMHIMQYLFYFLFLLIFFSMKFVKLRILSNTHNIKKKRISTERIVSFFLRVAYLKRKKKGTIFILISTNNNARIMQHLFYL